MCDLRAQHNDVACVPPPLLEFWAQKPLYGRLRQSSLPHCLAAQGLNASSSHRLIVSLPHRRLIIVQSLPHHLVGLASSHRCIVASSHHPIIDIASSSSRHIAPASSSHLFIVIIASSHQYIAPSLTARLISGGTRRVGGWAAAVWWRQWRRVVVSNLNLFF